MNITPTTLTIGQLLSAGNEQFSIPAYQRRYAWTRKQQGDLFNDVYRLAEGDSHLLGSIVCLAETHSAGINRLEVVDGQQRMTTLSILLKAIGDRFFDLGDIESQSEIENYLCCRGPDRKPQSKLLLGRLDNADYEKLIQKQDMPAIKNPCLRDAYDHFTNWLTPLTLVQLNQLYFKLINHIRVIRLDVGHAKDAYKLFETINNRGLSLSPTDIIKNFLLGHASGLGEDVLERVKDCWESVIVNCDRIDTDDFFRQYMCSVLRQKVSKSRLIDKFKRYYVGTVVEAEQLPDYAIYFDVVSEEGDENVLDGEDLRQEVPEDQARLIDSEDAEDDTLSSDDEKVSIQDFAQSLRRASEVYSKLLRREFENDKINRKIFDLQRIKSFPAYILLLDVFQHELPDSTKLEVLSLLETFMLRWHICEYRTGQLDDIFSKLTPVVADDIVSHVREGLAKHLPNDDEFRSKFSLHDYKTNFNRAKYVLERIEYDMIDHQGEYTLNGGDDLHLEHVIPQTITTKKSKQEYGDWVSYLGKGAVAMHKDHVHKIGNFTLLAKKLNIQASNNPFVAKQEKYRRSGISLTKQLAEEFSDFRLEQVKSRSKELAERAVGIWHFPEPLGKR